MMQDRMPTYFLRLWSALLAGSMTALHAAPLPADTTIFLSPSQTDPTPVNPTVEVTHRDTASLFVWVTTDATIAGLGLTIEARQSGIATGTGFDIFNPTVDSVGGDPVPRWQSATSGTLGELVADSNAVFVAGQTEGRGIDGPAGEDANPYFVGPNHFLFGRIDFTADTVGSTDLDLKVGAAGIADDLGNPIEIAFGAGESGTVSSTPGATGSVADGLINVLPRFADLDGDGFVDDADADLLLADWRQTGALEADLNGDEVVDDLDLGLLLGAWTGSVAAADAVAVRAAAIPEPTALVCFALAAAGLIARRPAGRGGALR